MTLIQVGHENKIEFHNSQANSLLTRKCKPIHKLYLKCLSQQHLHPATRQCVHHASQNPEGCTEQLVHIKHQQGARLTQVDAFQTLQSLLQHGRLQKKRRGFG